MCMVFLVASIFYTIFPRFPIAVFCQSGKMEKCSGIGW